MSIPKIIHYCWFGGNPLPEEAKRCINSWKKYCPEYEIVEWNESNFDITSNQYTKEAYENKKFAFVTDYVRLKAIVEFGGIYMDTDVELLKSLDSFLHHDAFSGFENDAWIPTGLMAGKKGNDIYKELLSYYDNKKFLNEDGSFDMTTNTYVITDMMLKHGLIRNGEYQVVNGFAFYPKDYFCPLDDATGVVNKTKNTVAIHWFSKTWMPKSSRLRNKITRKIHKWFGVDSLKWLKKLENKLRNK